MKKKEYIKVALILPGNVLITIPFFIFLFTKNSYLYDLISYKSFFFYIAIILLVGGLCLSIWSVRTFYYLGGDGTPGPWNPVTNLVVSGPYQYVRNPMILGVICLILFESIFFSSIPFLFWAVIFFIGNIVYFKFFEEKDLIKRFGNEYKNYKNKVSMLFPRFTPYNKE